MKIAAAVLALPLVAAKLTWSQCPGKWEIDVTNVTMNPPQAVGGSPIEVTISGKYSGAKTITRLFADVKGQGKIAFVSKSIEYETPGCPWITAGQKCPLKKGLFKWVVQEQIPSLPVNASGSAKIILFDKETSKKLGCLEMKTTIRRGFGLNASAEEVEGEEFASEIESEEELRM